MASSNFNSGKGVRGAASRPLSSLRFFWVIFLIVLTMNPLFSQGEGVGRIVGKLVDAESGEPLIFANVLLEGTILGAATDDDGVFMIDNVPPGSYTVLVTTIGYAETRMENVLVADGKSTQLEVISVKPEVIEGEEVTVEARFIQNTEASLLSKRLQADAMQDGLSAEAMSQSGADEAAEAMTQVTGASVLDGRYVYVRGLGDRYASTQLNGAELPSADPETRSFNFDLIPAGMLDNIITTKTFTPDQPGNFSGGVVNFGTRSFPEQLLINASIGASYNTQASLNSDFLSYPGGDSDWLGMDDGTRDLPGFYQNDPGAPLPTESQARRDPESAALLDEGSKAFSAVMAPSTTRSPLNGKMSLAIGNQTSLFGKPLGYFGSINYNRDYSFYDDGFVGRWKLTSNVDVTDSLSNQIALSDVRGVENVLWGGLGNGTLQLSPQHELKADFVRTQSGTNEARYLAGPWPEQLSTGDFETRVLNWKERALTSWQLRGDHEFGFLGGFNVNWLGSSSTSSQDEPDARYFSNTFSRRTVGGRDTTIYSIARAIIRSPARYFRNMNDDSRSFQVKLTKPFQVWGGQTAKFRTGWWYEEKNRQYSELLYEYFQGSGFQYTGDDQAFFQPQNVGVIAVDTTRNRFQFGNYINVAANILGGDYQGDQRINATFLMLDLPLTQKLRLIGGARLESARMNVSNGEVSGNLIDDDILPSISASYLLQNNLSLRAAYGKTLARPSFREKAPYANFEFVNDFVFNGNVDLQRTLIDNYDLRMDWFLQPGEIISLSGFYKRFKNPIERVIDVRFSGEGALLFYDNVDRAEVYGMEFELRKNLGFMTNTLRNFSFVGNASLIDSKVSIGEEQLAQRRALNPNSPDTREMQGQSPYLLNLNLVYQNLRVGTTATLYYNVFGSRLYEVSAGGTPDVYEKPRNMLNFNLNQHLGKGFSAKIAVKNILNARYEYAQKFKGTEYIRQQYSVGRGISLGLNYEL